MLLGIHVLPDTRQPQRDEPTCDIPQMKLDYNVI